MMKAAVSGQVHTAVSESAARHADRLNANWLQVQSYKSRVLFKAACAAIPEDAVVLEVGPHAIMRAPLRQNCATLPYVNTMKKGDDATLSVREAVAGLWRKGAALKWATPDMEEMPGVRQGSTF
jgi:acyl transferase domain-containing protein